MAEIGLRFAVVTDGHWGSTRVDWDNWWGYPDDGWAEMHADALETIEAVHDRREIDFLVHNGDIVHDDDAFHPEIIEQFFEELPAGVDWHVVRGNHDWSTEEEWESHYGVPFRHAFEYDEYGFVCTDTGGDPRDTNTSASDADWIDARIDEFDDKAGVFVFQHVAPFTERVGRDMPAVRDVFGRPDVLGVFLGHNHGRNGQYVVDGARYLYCSRIGGANPASGAGEQVEELGVRVINLYE